MIDKKYLEGLTFRSAARKIVEENGEKKATHVVEERPLTEEDILSFRKTDTEMIFVTGDGQKYNLPLITGKGK